MSRSSLSCPVLLRAELARHHAGETPCRAADRRPRRRYRRAASRAPARWSFRFRPRSRRDSRTAGSSRRGCRAGADSRAPPGSARARVPLSIASSTSCEPDSTPIHTSAQPARRSASTVARVIRSQRDCILNGICAPSRFDRGGELARPLLREREDVVGEPEMVGREARTSRPASPPPPVAAERQW